MFNPDKYGKSFVMRMIAAISALAVSLLVVGTWYITQRQQGDDQFAQCRAGQVAGGPGAIGGPFELVNSKWQTVTDQDVITEPSLIYFGYTFCP
ncbi:MAG TPA: SCO family protein, partial [Paracoccaceae bacterium]|nr:SCO family protein [Paracoccaceae bacterium]